MKIGIYSTAWNIIKNNFNYKDALDNWAKYANIISIAVNTSEDDTYSALKNYGEECGYNLKLIKTEFSKEDPFMYGKIENTALQNCDADLLIQQNLDERFRCDKQILFKLGESLINQNNVYSYFIPVINLYGSHNEYIDISRKWYIHKRGLNRGPVNFGIKNNGLPDYNKTSTDELIDSNGNLVPTFPLLENLSLNSLSDYIYSGMPVIYHLGYVDFGERISRNKFWIDFWEKATGGDKNNHAKSIEELAEKNTKKHNLPLWK